jgi:hypothetical protein
MMKTPNFDTAFDYSKLGDVRSEIREFLRNDPAMVKPHTDSWSCFDAAFSGRLGRAGFIGMTWPKRYGGGERSSLERYVWSRSCLRLARRPRRTGSLTDKPDRNCSSSGRRIKSGLSCPRSRAANASARLG